MQRKTYCDHLRIFATLAVVMLHVAGSNWNKADVSGLEWQVFNFYDSIVRWAVPVFIMISGSLFLGRDISLKTIYKKHILRLATAFFVWNIFYVLMTSATLKNGIIYGFKTHLASIFTGHYHMWFILMLIGLYMCIPIYRRIVSDDKATRYFLLLAFIFAFAVPWILRLLTDFGAYKYEWIQKAVDIIDKDVSVMNMKTVLGYSFYFILGYYLDINELKKDIRTWIYILGIAGFICTVLLELALALRTQKASENYYGNFNVNVLLEAVCVHTLFKYHSFKKEKLNRLAVTFSGYCFGIYLVHAFFIEKLSSILKLNTLSFNAIVSVPVIALIVFAASLCVSVILNHIPVIKKYCV